MLDGLRVLDRTTEIAGPYCSKLLADGGADVVKVERDEGDPLRSWRSGALFDFLNTSKRSVFDDGDLVAGADLVLSECPDDVRLLRERHPHLVVTTITPFGCDGPWAGRPATEFTLQALCGSIGHRGTPDSPPIAAGGRVGEFEAGTYAAVASLAALRCAEASGHGEHVDVAMLDCMAVTMTNFPSIYAEFSGWPQIEGTPRSVEVPSIEPTSDGFISFTTNSAQQFQDFLVMIGRSDLVDDEELAISGNRFRRRESFLRAVHAYTAQKPCADLLREAAAFRVPAGPVGNGATVTGFDHFVERGVFVPSPTGRFRQPRVPYRIAGRTARRFSMPPRVGEHQDTIKWVARQHAAGRPEKMPLAGIRILDCTAWWAGPSATHALGALGADVIKVESTKRPDLMRFASTKPATSPQWWEWGGAFHGVNTDKRGVAIDLGTPEGKTAFEALAETADVLVENYTPRVMESFGLGWERLHEVNPRLTMVRMPAFGLGGPWRERGGFAQTMESITGMAWVTGLEDGPPVLVRGACDPLAGMHAAVATLIALRSGHGQFVESVMVEAALNAAAEQVVEYEATGDLLTRQGNKGEAGVLQSVYRCAGNDRWIAVAASAGQQQEILGAMAGGVDDANLADFFVDRDAAVVAEQLMAAGVPAGAVIPSRDIAKNPQLRHRGIFEVAHHPVVGRREMVMLPFRMTRIPRWLSRPAPTIGQHNEEVLGPVLGAEELGRLRSLGVVGEGLR